MLNSDDRFRSLCGLLFGLAIGDALSQPHGGWSRKAAIRRFRDRRLRYRMWPGHGLYTDDTQLALMAGQAILQSRSESSTYHRRFASRLKWYAVSLPVGITRATFLAGLKAWISRSDTGCWSEGCAPASRALLLGVALHNTGHRYLNWSRDSASSTHRHPLACDGAAVLATVAQIGGVTLSARLNTKSSLDTLIKTARQDELRDGLSALVPFLEKNRSPREVAEHFGWHHGISRKMLPTTIMAVYCFLRYPEDFQRAVRWSLLICGKNHTLPAVVAGLVGAHIGGPALPQELVHDLADWPHDRSWIESLALRLADWPHGVDDLLVAPARPSHPIGQFIRNLLRWPLVLFYKLAGRCCA